MLKILFPQRVFNILAKFLNWDDCELKLSQIKKKSKKKKFAIPGIEPRPRSQMISKKWFRSDFGWPSQPYDSNEKRLECQWQKRKNFFFVFQFRVSSDRECCLASFNEEFDLLVNDDFNFLIILLFVYRWIKVEVAQWEIVRLKSWRSLVRIQA